MRFYFKLFFIFAILICTFSIFYRLLKNNDEIVIGTILPLSGINSSLGNNILIGTSTWINHINSNGGIDGKKIKFVAYDDWYEPKLSISELNSLINSENVFTLFGLVGSENIQSLLPIITQENIPLVSPFAGASFLRNTPQVANLGANYEDEIENIVKYLHVELGLERFAIFYQNDKLGEEANKALKKVLQKYNLVQSGEGNYARNTLFVENAIYELEKSNPQVIILASTYKPALGLINAYKDKDVYFASLSTTDRVKLSTHTPKDVKLISSQTLPPYENSLLGKEFMDRLKMYYPNDKPSQLAYEAYIGAKILTTMLSRNSSSRKLFLSEFNTKKELSFWDVRLTLDKKRMHNSLYLVDKDGKVVHTEKLQ